MKASQAQRLGERGPVREGPEVRAAVLIAVERGGRWRVRRRDRTPVGGMGCGRQTRSLNLFGPKRGVMWQASEWSRCHGAGST